MKAFGVFFKGWEEIILRWRTNFKENFLVNGKSEVRTFWGGEEGRGTGPLYLQVQSQSSFYGPSKSFEKS